MHTATALVLGGSLLGSLAASATERQQVELVLHVNKDTYAPLEPIVVQYSVVNNSASEVTLPQTVGAQSGWIKFEVGKKGGEFQPYQTGMYACTMSQPVPLKPHGSISSQLIMETNGYGRTARASLLPELQGIEVFPFAEPGSYRIRATYPLDSDSEGQHHVVASTVVEFSVRTALAQEKAALAFFTDQRELAAAVGGDYATEDLGASVGRWEEFVTAFPNSPYAPFVRLTLGTVYLNGTLGSSDPAKAAVHFRAVADRGPAAVADDATTELAKSLINLGRIDEARATLTSGLEKFGSSERRVEMTRLRDGLNKGLRSLQEIYSK